MIILKVQRLGDPPGAMANVFDRTRGFVRYLELTPEQLEKMGGDREACFEATAGSESIILWHRVEPWSE
jgi:hypothetical protein